MRHRLLGSLPVPAIGYGAMVLSPGMYGEIDDDQAIAALHHAFDAGATFVDTADAYGADGHNETLVGERSPDGVTRTPRFPSRRRWARCPSWSPTAWSATSASPT